MRRVVVSINLLMFGVHSVRRVVVSMTFWMFVVHSSRLLVLVGRIFDVWSSYREKGCRDYKCLDCGVHSVRRVVVSINVWGAKVQIWSSKFRRDATYRSTTITIATTTTITIIINY